MTRTKACAGGWGDQSAISTPRGAAAAGTAHIYADSASDTELQQLLTVAEDGILAEADGNTINQPLTRRRRSTASPPCSARRTLRLHTGNPAARTVTSQRAWTEATAHLRAEGRASLSGLIARLISASSVAAPPGFEPVFRGGHVFADIRSFLAGRSVENRLGIEIRGTQGASMDSVQEQHERAVGDAFVTWYNKQHGTEFRFSARGAEPRI